MIDRQTIAYLRLIHGSYNLFVMLLFAYQGWTGLKIREGKRKGKPDFAAVKKHRERGPILVVLGPLGFLAGAALIYADKGHIMEYPLHFVFGTAITFSIVAVYLTSRKIRGLESPWRNPHFFAGVLILFLYLIQVLLGLGILL